MILSRMEDVAPSLIPANSSATRVLPQYLLTPCSSHFEKLGGCQPVKKFPAFYGTESSLPHLQVTANGLYPEPAQSSPCPPNPIPGDPS